MNGVPISLSIAFRPQVLSMHFCSIARALPRSVHTRVAFDALKKASTTLRMVGEACRIKLLAQGDNSVARPGIEPTVSGLWAQRVATMLSCPFGHIHSLKRIENSGAHIAI